MITHGITQRDMLLAREMMLTKSLHHDTLMSLLKALHDGRKESHREVN